MKSLLSDNSVSLSAGPGQHAEQLNLILLKHGLLNQSFRTFPDLTVRKYKHRNLQSEKTFKSYSWIQRILFGLARRGYLDKRDVRYLVHKLAGKIIANNMHVTPAYISWIFIGLESMKKLKAEGSRIMLECPMSHIDKWREIIEEEKKFLDVHECYSDFSDRLTDRLKQEYEYADIIKVPSSYARKTFLEKGIPEKKLKVLPIGVEPQFLINSKIPKHQHARKIILYVGRIEILKGVQYLLEAFKALKRKDIELHLVGHLPPESSIILKDCDDRVKTFGVVSHDKIIEFYRNADIFVFPSLNDASGQVILEAMSQEIPVITTENSFAHDVIKNGEDGFIVPIRDAKAIKERIEILLDSDTLRQQMGQLAAKKVRESFSFEIYEQRTIGLINELVLQH